MAEPTRIGMSTSFDQDIAKRLAKAATDSGLTFGELIELWPGFSRRVNFLKIAALIEVFSLVRDLPGSIVECGVFRGQSLMLFRQLLEVNSPGDSLRKIIGFDTFSGFTSLDEKDGPPDVTRAKVVGGWDSSDFFPILQELINIAQTDSYMPRVNRVELVKGDVRETIPDYVRSTPGLRISLLNLDVDLYEPTLIALEHLYPRVVSGGVVIVDEYAMPGFPGESEALEEFFGSNMPNLKKFSFTATPGAYFIKN